MRSPPGLRDLQRQILALIRSPQGVAAELQKQGLSENDLEDLVAGDGQLQALGRVRVYAEMYRARLHATLRETYPKLASILGENRFAALVSDYLGACPSRRRSLRHLGDLLPTFLKRPPSTRPRCPQVPVWAADLAALEWRRHDVLDEVEIPALTIDRLRGLSSRAFVSLRVRLVPAHRLITTEHSVDVVWRTLSQEPLFEEPAAELARYLVWRQGTTVFHRPLDPIEAHSLALASTGCAFRVICDQIAADREKTPPPPAEAHEDVAQVAYRLLARWVKDELLADTTLS